MKRVELEHIIRAASGITKQAEIVIIGSQSILGQFPNASPKLLDSMEADVFPLRRPELSDEIDGVMGELSPFHQTHGIYAHGVAEDTAILPIDWKKRLIPVQNQNTGHGIGLCLEAHDLAVSKLVAGREKDIDFVQAMLEERMIKPQILEERIRLTPLSNERLELTIFRLRRINAAVQSKIPDSE